MRLESQVLSRHILTLPLILDPRIRAIMDVDAPTRLVPQCHVTRRLLPGCLLLVIRASRASSDNTIASINTASWSNTEQHC